MYVCMYVYLSQQAILPWIWILCLCQVYTDVVFNTCDGREHSSYLQVSYFVLRCMEYASVMVVTWCLPLLSQSGLGCLYVFSSFLPRPPPPPGPPRLPPKQHLPLTSKPFVLDLRYLAQRIYGSGECTGWPIHDLDPRSRLWHWLAKKLLVCTRM